MKGLLVKDMLSMKGLTSVAIVGVILIVLYSFMDMDISAFVIVFVGILSSVNIFDFDDKCHWDQMAITLPVKRSEIVKSRYLSILALEFAAIVFGFFVGLLLSNNRDVMEKLFVTGIVSSIVFLYLAIYLPIIYKLGITKGRYVAALTVACLFVVFFSLTTFVGNDMIRNAVEMFENNLVLLNTLPFITLAVSLLIYVGSMKVACHVYEKKDF